MNITEVSTAADNRAIGRSKYMWNCWGPNAQFIDFADISDNEFCRCVFDDVTHRVYEITLYVPGQDQTFKWFDPEFKDAYFHEAKMRDVEPYSAYDGMFYDIIDSPETAIEYIKDIGSMYYDELPIPQRAF